MVDTSIQHHHHAGADDDCCLPDSPLPPPGSRPKELFDVLTPPDAYAVLEAHLPRQVRSEQVPTVEALGRVLAEELHSPGDLPSFPRSTMDGFAVRAADTFGASEGLPAYLTVGGEVFMGRRPDVRVSIAQAAQIATGGM